MCVCAGMRYVRDGVAGQKKTNKTTGKAGEKCLLALCVSALPAMRAKHKQIRQKGDNKE